MGSTLQEQFLKMGLVDKKQVKKAKKTQHLQKTGKDNDNNASKAQAQQAFAEKKKRSKLLNQKKNEEAKERETASRIRQLIETNRVLTEGGDTPYNFTDHNKIKRLFLPKETVERLSNGALAIVRQAGEYQIIPAEIAEKVREHNKKLIVVYHSPLKSPSQAKEDPYAKYQVPDDLMW